MSRRKELRRRVERFAREHPVWSFLALPALVALLCALAGALIRTERERVDDVIAGAQAALEAGDVGRVMGFVAPDFRQEGMDAAELRQFIRTGLNTYGPPTIVIHSRDYDIQGDSARCSFKVLARFPRSAWARDHWSRSLWRVGLRRNGRRWCISEVVPLELEKHPVDGLLGLGRRYMKLPGDLE
jgi:hypothetical protein